jgi:hypothetical protein
VQAQSILSAEVALTTMTNMEGDVLRIGEAEASQAQRELPFRTWVIFFGPEGGVRTERTEPKS